MKKRIWLSWSSGKDSAWALHALRRQGEYEVAGLLTTINAAFDRVAIHGTRRALVEMQAEAAGVPLIAVPLPWPCTNADYETAMKKACDRALSDGIAGVAFGDLFLADVRQYRERQMAGTGLYPVFPLWEIPTGQLAGEMVDAGLRAKLVCVDPRQLDPGFAGRDFDRRLLAELPPRVDPCGERGEFHTFVYGGPMFQSEIPVALGEIVEKDGFWFADLDAVAALPR